MLTYINQSYLPVRSWGALSGGFNRVKVTKRELET